MKIIVIFLYHLLFILRTVQNLKLIWRKLEINKKNLIKSEQGNYDCYKKAVKTIEIATESIPQLIFQFYIALVIEETSLLQKLSILTSTSSIVIGLSSILGFEAFFYYFNEKLFNRASILQIIIRMGLLIFWYSTVVIPRLYLIAVITKTSYILLFPLFFSSLVIFVPINILEIKKIQSNKPKKRNIRVELLFDLFNYMLSFIYLIFGVYKTVFTKNDYLKSKRHSWHYFVYYFLFYLQNSAFGCYLYVYYYDLGENDDYRKNLIMYLCGPFSLVAWLFFYFFIHLKI